ncbi:MAG TPA: metallophosphoesterase [Chloroflexota bacterium]|nr:metallophosphoesterase [Chloroflexota bacterium]
MATRIGLITDLHYRGVVPGTAKNLKRESRKAGELLRRSLEEFSRRRVDALIVAGDCVDDETQPGVLEDVAALGELLAASGLRVILVPGNHDPAPETFYGALPAALRPPRYQRVGECEVLTFGEDVSTEGTEQALRSATAMAEMETVLREPGPVTLVVQHYVVFPDHEGPGYNHTYQNAAQIRGLMEGSPRRVVSVSGHYHRGYPLTEHNGVRYFTGRALCEAPYPYYVIEVEGEEVRVEEAPLAGE